MRTWVLIAGLFVLTAVCFIAGVGFISWWHSCSVGEVLAKVWWLWWPSLWFNVALGVITVLGYLVVINYQKWRSQ